MAGIINYFKEANINYREYREHFIKKQLTIMTVASTMVVVYALIAPVLISAIFNQLSFETLSIEFIVLGLVCLPICIGFWILMKAPEGKIKHKGLIYELLSVLFYLGSGVLYSVIAIYITFSSGEVISFSVYYIISLVFVSAFIVNPHVFITVYVISLVAILSEIGMFKPDLFKEAYNMAFFAIIAIILYISKYKTGLNSYRKNKEIARLQDERHKFMVSLTHEMRTPLNSVLGKNQLILAEVKDENIRNLSQQIGSSGKVLLSLINDILDMSKIESGKMTIVPSNYSFPNLIKELEDIMVSESESRGLKLVTDIEPDIPEYLYGDEVRIKQIVLNLLSNAVKYTPKGTVKLIAKFNRVSENEGELQIAVQDTGMGIKEEDLKKLSKAFVRLDEEKNKYTQGTGLGLSISGDLLNMMGSAMKVESVYGEGSTFSFTIKQGIAESDSAEAEIVPKTDEKFMAPDAKVLIVDDNMVNISVASRLMKLFGIMADSTLSGAEGIKKICEKKYDIVFLDHMMPEMDGVETLRKLKAEHPDRCEGTVFVALTANFDANAEKQYSDYGFDTYLAKPIELKSLERILKRSL